ncbi:MAG: Bax inhibitor-1/YccA family protein [Candidatus Izemoplasmataceae bacterium]
MRFRSTNPVYRHVHNNATIDYAESVSYSGVILKSSILFAIVAVIASYIGLEVMSLRTVTTGLLTMIVVAPLFGFIMVLIAMFRPTSAKITGPMYAAAQGVTLGAISGIYEVAYGGGIVFIALLATFGVFASMLTLYATGLVRVTEFFRRFLYTMLLGLVFTSFIMIIVYLIGGTSSISISFIFAITIISIIIASLYLLVDFDNIVQAVEGGVDKRYEWVLALGLIITIIWLYIEILRLVAILTSRRR